MLIISIGSMTTGAPTTETEIRKEPSRESLTKRRIRAASSTGREAAQVSMDGGAGDGDGAAVGISQVSATLGTRQMAKRARWQVRITQAARGATRVTTKMIASMDLSNSGRDGRHGAPARLASP